MGIKGDHHYTAIHYWWEGKVIEKGEGRFIITVGKEKCEWWRWGEETISFQTVLSKNFLS